MAIKDFRLLTKVKDMMLYAYPVLTQFPKAEKFSLAADIRHSMNELLRLTIAEDKKYTKKTTLENMDIENEYIQNLIEISMELKYISFHKYETWLKYLVEIGKMIGGLQKSVNGKPVEHRD